MITRNPKFSKIIEMVKYLLYKIEQISSIYWKEWKYQGCDNYVSVEEGITLGDLGYLIN